MSIRIKMIELKYWFKSWILLVPLTLSALFFTGVSLAVGSICVVLLYFVVTEIGKVPFFNAGYSMAYLGIGALFALWGISRPFLKVGFSRWKALFKAVRFFRFARREPQEANAWLEEQIAKKKSSR